MPFHAWGPDKGTKTCPVCKYGRYHGIIYFVGNHTNWDHIRKWLSFLEKVSVSRNKYLKVYFVYGNENDYQKETIIGALERLGKELNIENMALTFVPSLNDKESEVYLNRINPEVENTIIIYRQRTIIDKFINLNPSEYNFNRINSALDRTQSIYFDLSEPRNQ